eukprot:1963822-Amphidinium_carterae.1
MLHICALPLQCRLKTATAEPAASATAAGTNAPNHRTAATATHTQMNYRCGANTAQTEATRSNAATTNTGWPSPRVP